MTVLRHLALAAALTAAACGGNSPSPEAPAASAEPAASASAGADMPTAAAEASAAPAPAPAAATRAPATLDGAIAGKPFQAVAACVFSTGKEPGTVYLEIFAVKGFDVKSCGSALSSDKDARKLGMEIAWKEGAETDAAKLKGGKEPQLFLMSGTGNPKKFDRKDTGKDFKPKGKISVLRAGAKKGDVARIKLDLDMGKDKLKGEVDVDVIADLAR
jgi:hypothetical protein